MPYNLVLEPKNDALFDPKIIQRVELGIDARARHAEVVYSETNDSVIGFDLKVKGKPLFMAPIVFQEDQGTIVDHSGLFVNLPAKPECWESAKTSLNHFEKEYTKREKFMLNKNSDLLIRFRNPDAELEATTEIVDLINKTNHLSLNGITKVNRFEVLANNKQDFFIQAFKSGTRSAAVLEVEYQEIETKRLGKSTNKCVGFYVGVMFAFLVSLFTFLGTLSCEHTKWKLLALFVTITLLEVIIWGGIIF